jgi:Arc/MetJ-type ribon-helix-helix transcriptional regulator
MEKFLAPSTLFRALRLFAVESVVVTFLPDQNKRCPAIWTENREQENEKPEYLAFLPCAPCAGRYFLSLTTSIAVRIISVMTKTVSLRLDQRLLRAVEVASKSAHKDRSEVVSEALELWLKRRTVAEKVRRHGEGYARRPVARNEFAPVLKAQTWPE